MLTYFIIDKAAEESKSGVNILSSTEINMKEPYLHEKECAIESSGQNEKVRIGVIGAGKMGLLHTGIFNSIPGGKVVAISEKQGLILGGLKDFIKNVDFYSDYKEMLLKAKIDAVIIATPTFLHKEMIIDALTEGKSVFVEKPLARNYEECKEILKRVDKNVTFVGYCRRFMATYGKMKATVDSGILGRPLAFEGRITINQVRRKMNGPQYSLSLSGGGVMTDLGCHLIDMIHYILGDFKQVNSTKSNYFSKDVEDFMMSTAVLKNGAIGSIQTSWSYGGSRYPEMSLQIEFENGRIEATDRDISIVLAGKDSSSEEHRYWTKQQISHSVPIDLAGPEYTLEDIHFLDCIKGGKKSICGFDQSMKTNNVIDSFYQSIELGKSIKIISEVG
jgi:predicted dehydrogenase